MEERIIRCLTTYHLRRMWKIHCNHDLFNASQHIVCKYTIISKSNNAKHSHRRTLTNIILWRDKL